MHPLGESNAPPGPVVQFPEPLTELQKQFTKGARFEEDGEEFVALGLEWGVGQSDCTIFYCTKTDFRTMKQLDDDAVLPTATSRQYARRSGGRKRCS
jgi:hypothetical protein